MPGTRLTVSMRILIGMVGPLCPGQVAVMSYAPSASGELVMLYCPLTLATPPPTCVPFAKIVTLALGALVPTNVGVLSLVMLSVLLLPLSLLASRSGCTENA